MKTPPRNSPQSQGGKENVPIRRAFVAKTSL